MKRQDTFRWFKSVQARILNERFVTVIDIPDNLTEEAHKELKEYLDWVKSFKVFHYGEKFYNRLFTILGKTEDAKT